MVLGNVEASAVSRYGVIGGMSFSRASEMNRSSMTQWHVGATYKLGLPLGFSIQPSLIYQNKGAKTTDQLTIKTSYLELPVSVQWGPDLLICRPFLDVTPFIGYAVGNKTWDTNGAVVKISDKWDSLNRFEYGLGLGIGLEIWRFQVIGRYMWNFGTLADVKNSGKGFVREYISTAFDKGSYRGFMLSVAFLFGGGKKK
ncbi:MAG: PorT family protein [Porphyromonadaceae bacterium]|nr:PorT family protein [Porphyromonadaceae bacterium]